jgi:DNA-binding transcriptional regulator GbsR (MarR family)
MVVVCPRCGGLGYLDVMRVNGREYYRVIHVLPNRKRVKHYIGAKDKYIYVNKLHKLDLTNLLAQDISVLIQNAVDNFIELSRVYAKSQKDVKELLSKIKQIMHTLVMCAKNLEKLYNELSQLVEASLESGGVEK